MNLRRGFFILRESMISAISSLYSNKLRSFLTLLGIIIGVFMVIAILSVINGFNHSVEDSFANLGTRVLHVQRRPWHGVGQRKRRHRSWWRFPRLRSRELSAIQKCSSVEYVVPQSTEGNPVQYGESQIERLSITGSSEDLMNVLPLEIEKGRFFSHLEVERARFVCVLGHQIFTELDAESDSTILGDRIKIGALRYKVIGKLKKVGTGMSFGSSDENDGTIFIPMKTWFRQFGYWQGYDNIMVSATDDGDLDDLQSEVVMRLRRVRNLGADSLAMPNNFFVNRQDMLLAEYEKTTSTLWAFVIGIGALSLLVGGIGVMNIMLISVTERTKEIGLRKALGAKKRYILYQFLLEALLICWFGGAIGISFGVIVTWLISRFTPVPFALSMNAVYLGFAFTSCVGLFFGIYPAVIAANKDPVVALRYE